LAEITSFSIAGLTPIEEVERTNTVMVYLNQWVKFAQYNPYVMEVDREN